MTTYQIRNAQLDGIYIDFVDEQVAAHYWRGNIENCSDTDSRKGAVMGRYTRESEAEADRARLDWLDGNRSAALSARRFIRDVIDDHRKLRLSEFVQLLPLPNKE